MSSMIDWIKKNKVTAILILVVLFLLIKATTNQPIPFLTKTYSSVGIGGVESLDMKSSSGRSVSSLVPSVPTNEAPPTDIKDRLVVQESNLSMVVKNVRDSVKKATDYATNNGGYLVNSSLSQPEEAPYASLTLRIPAKNLNSALDYFRSLAVKVSSENLYGHDVTDEYVDVQARLDTLNKTKAKFEQILTQAVSVQDILTVQRELVNLQDQIDSLKGQQQYLEKTAELSRVTIYFSTDEFALPYAPANTFRPAVIFKLAVRSLVGTFRAIVENLIWVVVYAVIWVPVLLIVLFLKKRLKKK